MEKMSGKPVELTDPATNESIQWDGSKFTNQPGIPTKSLGTAFYRHVADPKFKAVCYSTLISKFVAVGEFGVGIVNLLATSSDGITWTDVDISGLALTAPNLYGVIASGAIIVAVGEDNGHELILSSTDGAAWTDRTVGTGTNLMSVCWSGALFVAVGSNTIFSSSNGTAWTKRDVPVGEGNAWKSVSHSSTLGLFVAVAANGTNRAMSSADGTTWTARACESEQWYAVCWSAELAKFCAVGVGVWMVSTNGTTWTTHGSLPGILIDGTVTTLDPYSIAWGAGPACFYSVAGNWAVHLMSSDGENWFAKTYSDEGIFATIDVIYPTGICYSSTHLMFVSVGDTEGVDGYSELIKWQTPVAGGGHLTHDGGGNPIFGGTTGINAVLMIIDHNLVEYYVHIVDGKIVRLSQAA